MKYVVLIGDGMSDKPLKRLNGKTPLEAANTPNMDYIAKGGTTGWANNVPKGMPPGSDVAGMSIFGYNPKKYYSGRGPLEAASLGVKLKKDDIAFRCNLISVKDRKMKDFTAGHISTKEAKKIIEKLNKHLGTKDIKFYTGLSYRHLLVINKKLVNKKIITVPPHDITGKKIGKYLPAGKGEDLLLRLMNESEVILHQMKSRATTIWPWGQGAAPKMPSLKKQYGKKGAIITAVHLLKGLGKILGLKVINVPGATGYLDTNYKGKAEYALRALKKHDMVFVHVEAPDEAGHEGDVKKKIRAIEDFDRYVVGTILKATRKTGYPETRILVLPDHPTPIVKMTHTMDAVPFAIYPFPVSSFQFPVKGYNEKEIGKSKLKIKDGYTLLGKFLKGKL
jgi:2,3-bisphosphoglycerate-independent phosphoglycerate mutase